MKKRLFQSVAHTLLLSFAYQLVFPACAYALTTGPSQPEVQSFEPVGTTEMVDMFSGDFNYNIPLLDVEGYPVNIFYHSGVGMEQEASWVGLGWNINPGEINRTVRGLPDDFNGDTIEKFTHIKEEHEYRVGAGANFSTEVFGKDIAPKKGISDSAKFTISLGGSVYVAQSNYRGMSAGIKNNIGFSMPGASVGISMGVGSQSGADVDLNASASTSTKITKGSMGLSISGSTGFNSRTGLKDISLGVNPTMSQTLKPKTETERRAGFSGRMGTGLSASIPIGIQNYVPVITNKVNQTGFSAQLKGGWEMMGGNISPYFDVSISNISYDEKGSRAGYGYLYSENADKNGIHDFSRDKDGMYNTTMKNLPAASLAYDVYTVNGQGTGGMFRPYRNDIGSIHDPYVSDNPASEQNSVLLEFGIGNLFEVGSDLTQVYTANKSGPWDDHQVAFSKDLPGTLYEKVFFKNGGELTYNQQQDVTQLFNTVPQFLAEDMSSIRGGSSGTLPNTYSRTASPARLLWDNSTLDRSSRATHISFRTARQAMTVPKAEQDADVISYENGSGGKYYDPKLKRYKRYSKNPLFGYAQSYRQDLLSEFTQTMADGRRYIYDIPAMNNVSREVSFAADESRANLNSGYVGFNRGVDDNVSNRKGRDNFYSTTNTPAHAHSFLLSTVLSADYVDVMGDGPTDDDPGAFTKFNYTLSDSDYRWRTPYHKDSAQFDPGYWSDGRDGKGNYLIGSRQQWYLRSIESKNYIAEFYVSKRKDARGVRDSILASTSNIRHKSIDLTKTKTDSSFSYQLDSIKLFNKHDRYINKENAVAVKTVILQYDYSLCPGVPNNVTGGGKLTLKKLFIRYGNSQKNLLSPYVFDYGNTATGVSNLAYNFSAKDRWGNYKAVNAQLPNFEYPYTDQPVNGTDKAAQDKMLSSWNLTDIKLPSGGKIHMDYESDDYGYVQDKRAMQMIRIEGAGASPNLDRRNTLYQGLNDINDYVYFKRRKDQERPGLSLKDNYLEDQDLIYYNFNLDITGTGKEEYVKGYARFDEINVCPDNSDYAYIKLRRDNAGNLKLHPATIYGVNMAKYYLPHLFYPGYSETASGGGVWKGLIGAAGELVSTLVMENPFKRFIRQHKAKYFKPSNSWLRLQSPSLAKQGGGIRVKQLTLTDSWNTLSGNDAASYGKKYDYTITDRRYGKISSGVASYEPMIGADENPFRRPVPYTAEGGRLLPSTDFFQEEPFGESFFPGASVGYSSVKVTSIHQAYSRSSQAMDEYLFYTAKDHPVRVEYTEKTGPGEIRERDLRKLYMEERVLQGYAIVLNDMHGKAKAVNNYVIHNDGSNSRPEQITGVQYFYKTDGNKRLDNMATAFVRKRGTTNTYELKNIKLGMDVDFTVDSRQRKTQTSTSTTSLNLNVFQVGIIPLFPFTLFNSETDDTRVFRSLVSTKIVQQYGLLEATEQFDHGAITRMESLVYDAETGGVLLSRTSNKYGDYQYQRTDPAYLAYEGMRPAYTNAGYTETVDSLVVNDYRDGFLFTDNLDRFTAGDELLVELPASGMADYADGVNLNRKLWVTGKGLDTAAGEDKSRKTESPEDPVIPEPVDDSGFVVFGRMNDTCLFTGSYITINIHAAAAGLPFITSGSIIAPFPSSSGFSCGTPGCYTLKLRPGTYVYVVSFKSSTGGSVSVRPAAFTVTAGSCTKIVVAPCGSMAPFLIVPTPTGGKRCALKVAPRFKDKFAPGTTSPNLSGWPTSRTVYKNVKVTVMRSGRRNNLDKSVQQTAFAQPASTASIYSSLATLMGKNDNLLSVAANTFTDTALITHPYNDTLKIPGDYDYGGFNPYVLGTRGTYRPLATYVPFTARSYSKNHERFDGTFTLTNAFWNFVNSAGMPLSACDAKTDVLQANSLAGSLFWKRASLVTRYDVFGNELEELDPVGNYTSAQYGYNNGLPQAVASNVQAQYFMFDGFEEYHNLVPRTMYQLYKRNEQHSPFARLLGGIFSDLSATYPSENLAAGSRPEFNRNGQNYYLRNTAAGGALSCTRDASHTGLYSMKVTGATDIRFEVRPPQTNVSSFRMAYGKQYVLNLWARSTTPGAAIGSGQFQTKVHTGWISDMTIKTGSIDGWFLLEAGIDLRSIFVPSYVFLKLPAGVYVDDIRLMPVESNMKSFVYDPLTYRLAAQLDENHFAAFYEYDQEGLLIRTKKETEKGIITITESRRANTKN